MLFSAASLILIDCAQRHVESNQKPSIHLQDDDTILCFSHFLSQVAEILSRQLKFSSVMLRYLSPIHLLVISESAVRCEGAQGEKNGEGKWRFYCIPVHPALMRPPSLSAHLSPAGLAAQGPHVCEEVCLCACICVCLCSRDVLGINSFS